MNRSNGLRIAIRPARMGSQVNFVTAGIPVSLIMLLGIALVLCEWFPSVTLAWWQLAVGMVALTALLWALRLTGHGRAILIGLLVAVIALCGIAYRQVVGGFGCLVNDVLDKLTLVTGRIYLDFAVPVGASPLWGLLPLTAICVILLQLALQTGRILFLIPGLLCAYASVLIGLYPMDAGMILLSIGTVLFLMQSTAAKNDYQSWWGMPSWMIPIVLCAMLAGGMGLVVGEGAIETAFWKESLHDMLYDQDTNSMPEGNLKNLPAWNKSDTPALEISMTVPQKLYLRGTVYENYDGASWKQLTPQARAEYENLFYWLHQSGFYGQSQIGTASSFTTQVTPEEITIKNLSACSSRGYYPYALGSNDTLDESLIGDADFPESTVLQYYPGSVPQWYEVQHQLASAQGRNNISDYLDLEEAYEAYVTQMDLQLTNESWSVLNRQLGEQNAPQTLSQIREFIQSWLEEKLVYDEQVKTLNGSSDFLQYTLEGSGSGYSVHYATAATLMLRYFGVPARYVEGYFLSAAEAASYQPGQSITLTEIHAHAWAEYYLPGVGFVPFEVTPGYIDDEELELGGSLAQQEQTYTGDHLKYAQVEQPERIEEPEQKRFSFSMKPIYLLYFLLVIFLILFIIVFVKRYKFRRTIRTIDQADNRECITMRFGYTVRLRHSCVHTHMIGAQRAEELNREALFSNHEMTRTQREEMDEYARQVQIACKKGWTIPQKLRYKLWDCLY